MDDTALAAPTTDEDRALDLVGEIHAQLLLDLEDGPKPPAWYMGSPVVRRGDGERITLPEPRPLPAVPIGDVIARRSSRRDYAPDALCLHELSSFLHHVAGLKQEMIAYGLKRFPVRMSPSGGGLQPVDVYLFVNAVEGLDAGLYHYDGVRHELELVEAGVQRARLVDVSPFQPWVPYAPVMFAMCVDMRRTVWKYGARAYRLAHIDTGVLTQSMYLVGTALGWSSCACFGFGDDELNELLGADGRERFGALMFAAGYPPRAGGAHGCGDASCG